MKDTQHPYLHRETTRHGKVVWYVHKRPAPRVRLLSAPGTPEFDAEYRLALGAPPEPPSRAAKGSLRWLADQYRHSAAWAVLKPATRRQRENILKHVLDAAGTEPFLDVDQAAIRAAMDLKKDRPNAARNFLETMRGIFRWALEAQHIEVDPTVGIRAKRKTGEGFRPWTADEIARFEQRWPIGTRERLALDLLRLTGLRRGDACKVGRQHVKDQIIMMPTEKTGEVVCIPILPPLAASIAACPSKGLTFIAQADGSPMTTESVGNFFRLAVRSAGLTGISAHGLRKSAANMAAENGATVAELEAIFGWRGGGMASLYTRKADRVRLSKQAIEKLMVRTIPEVRTSAPEVHTSAPKKKRAASQ